MNRRRSEFLDTHKMKKNSKIITKMQEYYTIKDLEENKNHLEVFNATYVSDEYLGTNEIAEACFVSVSTVERYIAKFNVLAEKLFAEN